MTVRSPSLSDPAAVLPAAPVRPGDPATGHAWRLAPMARLRWRCVDAQAQGWVVHDAGSGHTHALDPYAAVVLDRLEEGPATVAGLQQWLLDQLGEAAQADAGSAAASPDGGAAHADRPVLSAAAIDALARAIAELQAAGLVDHA